jgi:hypothetical protein
MEPSLVLWTKKKKKNAKVGLKKNIMKVASNKKKEESFVRTLTQQANKTAL